MPGLRAYPQVPPAIPIGGQQTKALYQFTLSSSDLKELKALKKADKAKAKLIVVDGHSM